MSDLSSETRTLLRAARDDRPNAGSREAMWRGVQAAAAAPAALATAKGLSGKLVLGTLLGGVVTVGLAGALLALRPAAPGASVAPEPIARRGVAERLPRATVAMEARAQGDVARARGGAAAGPGGGEVARAVGVGTASGAGAGVVHASRASARIADTPRASGGGQAAAAQGAGPGDELAREARLVSEARGALLRGDPDRALTLLGVIDALPKRKLEPEELTLRARALRAVGRADEARAAENALIRRYPDQILP